ncbi:MAG: FlgD immunoglobulin-like domain containing protein [Candidatus Edwardsbacteria bacterium]|nr:FlgD immunoglobulin-like domain containing protein [Candidatus Edwardsbacteria bacterium]
MFKSAIRYLLLALLFVTAPVFAQFQRVIDDFRVNDPVGWDDSWYPDIACDRNGNFVVVWTCRVYEGSPTPDTCNLYYQRYDSVGNRIGGNVLLSYNIPFHGSSVAMNPNGRFVIGWAERTSSINQMRCQIFDSTGTMAGDDFLVNDTTILAYYSGPKAAMDSAGNFVVCWCDNRVGNNDVYFKRYDDNGNPISGDVKVSDDTANASQSALEISMNRDGRFVMVWEDPREGGVNPDIYTQRYDAAGIAQGNNFKVNDDAGDSNQGGPDVSLDNQGNFVVAWGDGRLSQYGYVYAQRYDSLGNTLGANFKVSVKDTSGSPSIAHDIVGNFLICWQQGGLGVTSSKIIAQRYDINGTVIGSNFYVNNLSYPGDRMFPQVNGYGDNNYLLVWQDSRLVKDGTWHVYANKWGTYTGVNDEVDENGKLPGLVMVYQNNPNPFNNRTRIHYKINKEYNVSLRVYNLNGELVKTLVDRKQSPGFYGIAWDGTNREGKRSSAGCYFYILATGSERLIRKCLLIK